MSGTVVDRLYNEFRDLVAYLDQGAELSLRSTADENFRKALLLAAASYFERKVCDDIVVFVENMSFKNQLVSEFVKKKAVSRQYHTFFDWESRNASTFFGLFGDAFKTFMRNELKVDLHLDRCATAFIELGRERNRLVHQDFGSFSLEKTSDEIYQLYQEALHFVESIPIKMQQFLQQSQANNQ